MTGTDGLEAGDVKKGGLLMIDQVARLFDVKKVEVEKWISSGLLPVHEIRPTRKYGRTLNVRMFDYGTILAIPQLDHATRTRLEEAAARRKEEEARGLRESRERRAREAAEKAAKAEAEKRIRKKATQAFQASSGFSRYHELFPLARGMDRRLVLYCGPTNSGKTHQALRHAMDAGTAEILSPLRLLALEHYETLSANGLSSGLITGEEKRVDGNPTHIARTIETTDFHRTVETAVIDEVQMLADRQRGWAWTAAVIGVPAVTVVMTGSPEAVPLVRKIAEITGEKLEVVHLERKGRLSCMERPLELHEVRKGDAVIVFTRDDVHKCRKLLGDAGNVTTAAIYGSLGPEVRAKEAKRFAEGRADVLVATDAIGMGLNLGDIARVFFTTTEKFDGVSKRALSFAEIRQIGGRAGRYGKAEEGFIGTVRYPNSVASLRRIAKALQAEPERHPLAFGVMPNLDICLKASAALDSDDLPDVLGFLKDALVKGDGVFKVGDMAGMLEAARTIRSVGLPIDVQFRYATAPVKSGKSGNLFRLNQFAREHAGKGKVQLPRPGTQDGSLESMEALLRDVDLYLWLSQRFPEAYFLDEQAREERRRLNASISKAIKARSSRKKLSRKERAEIVRDRSGRKPRRRHFGTCDEDDDDYGYAAGGTWL